MGIKLSWVNHQYVQLLIVLGNYGFIDKKIKEFQIMLLCLWWQGKVIHFWSIQTMIVSFVSDCNDKTWKKKTQKKKQGHGLSL